MIKYAIAVLFACIVAPVAAHGATVTPLTAADIPALTTAPAQGERIVALWSLDCRYCEANLTALAKLAHAHPDDVQLILVATDNPSRQQAVVARLQKMGMGTFRSYLYADAAPDRLNYLIDPDWGGELPRTIVIRADGSRNATSGELKPTQLRKIHP